MLTLVAAIRSFTWVSTLAAGADVRATQVAVAVTATASAAADARGVRTGGASSGRARRGGGDAAPGGGLSAVGGLSR
ncbi:hypothetical protein Phou_005060 [Phytohabitans houttuyneae]|uniref:Secreted protein n=1 Tax=Phytohabitans houttuyneae TaxID=1076126 RepID=A0A6V8K2Y5_9ACTN|nr:hypothetical protein Phou_005060 [Phytohabitans houttuyneae]